MPESSLGEALGPNRGGRSFRGISEGGGRRVPETLKEGASGLRR